MKKFNFDIVDNTIPGCFSQLLRSGIIDENNIDKTDDGFFCLNKCISDILAEKEIYTFPADGGTELKCENYYDDWYIYALGNEDGFVYGLFKLLAGYAEVRIFIGIFNFGNVRKHNISP